MTGLPTAVEQQHRRMALVTVEIGRQFDPGPRELHRPYVDHPPIMASLYPATTSPARRHLCRSREVWWQSVRNILMRWPCGLPGEHPARPMAPAPQSAVGAEDQERLVWTLTA